MPDALTHCAACGLPANPLFACDRAEGWRCESCFEKTPCYTEPHEEGCETIMWSDDA